MAKLNELVDVGMNKKSFKIQGKEIPVAFTFESLPYLEEAYGKSYHKFEKDLNNMMKKGAFTLGKKETRLMKSLIYAMIRSGGTDATISEVENAIPLSDLPDIFQVVFEAFNIQSRTVVTKK